MWMYVALILIRNRRTKERVEPDHSKGSWELAGEEPNLENMKQCCSLDW